MVSGVGPLTCRALLEQFGGAAGVLGASEAALRAVPGVGPKLAAAIARAAREADVAGELDACRRQGVRLLPQNAADYPEPLQRIPDPPPLLYVRGEFAPRDALAIALVGSRRCTPYGLRI